MTKVRTCDNIHKKPFFSQHIKLLKNSRSATGGVLALASGLTIIIVIIGIALFYITELFSGDTQFIYATDAAAMAAARQIPSITISPAQINALPSNFKGLGTDPNGVICPDGTYGNGNPALFGEMAYNNCAGLAMMNAFKAAASGSASDIASASTDIVGLNVFAQELTAAIKNSQNPPNAAAQLLQNNSIGNLPVTIFGGSKPSAYLADNSLVYGYYSTPGSCSNQFFTSAFINQNPTITSYVKKVTSTIASANGSNYVKGNTAFILKDITGNGGFVDANGKPLIIAFISSQPNDLTHNISTQLSNFSTTPPNPPPASSISSYDLPPNSLKLITTTNSAGSSSTPSEDGNSGVPKSGSGSNRQANLTVLSAAVANIPAQEVLLPTSPSPVTTTSTSAGAYVAIRNGNYGAWTSGDYMTNLSYNGWLANALTDNAHCVLQLSGTTPIAFDDSKGDLFDLMTQDSFTTWIIAGADSITGTYDTVVKSGWGVAGTQAFPGNATGAIPGIKNNGFAYNAPAVNFNNVVDGTASPSIPFMFVNSVPPAGAPRPVGNTQAQTFITTYLATGANAALVQIQAAYEPWILYNRSKGTGNAQNADALGKDPSKDPLGPGGSPALFAKNPNAMVPNCAIRATSTSGQTVTIAQALKIVDYVILNNGYYLFYGQDGWVNNLLSVVCGNYGINYLPKPIAQYKPNGFTGVEWLKAQLTCLRGGLGITQKKGSVTILPSTPAEINVPSDYMWSNYQEQTAWGATANWLLSGGSLPSAVMPSVPANQFFSGIRYFTPFDTNGNLVHPAWPEPANCQKFMTPGTVLQLLENMNTMNFYNKGKFNPLDAAYNDVIGSLTNTVQQLNANITQSDLLTVLDSKTIDLGQVYFLYYDKTQSANHGLVLANSLPNGQTYQPLASPAPYAGNSSPIIGKGYFTCYPLTGYCESVPAYATDPTDNSLVYGPNLVSQPPKPLQNVIDTTPAPNSLVSYNNQLVCPAPYGDNKIPNYSPYLFYYGGVGIGTPVACDYASYLPGAGTGTNYGELTLWETIGAYQDWTEVGSHAVLGSN